MDYAGCGTIHPCPNHRKMIWISYLSRAKIGDYYVKRLRLLNDPERKQGDKCRAGRASGGTVFTQIFVKGLILAQNERWRRGLGMQVEREP
jgi:hypothetical protein